MTVTDPHDYPFKGTLRDHQATALREAGLKRGHAFWIDAGGGKTGVCIAEASQLYQADKIDGVIVLAPLGPNQQWVTEQFPEWCDVPWGGVHNKEGKRAIDTFFRQNSPKMGVLSLNYDALRTKPGRELIDRFRAKYRRIYLVLDESSKLKGYAAKRTKLSKDLATNCHYVRILSGTPILKGLEDLYSQYDLIKPGMTGFHRFTAYRNYYCKTAPIPGARSAFAVQIIGYRNEGELRHRTRPYATRIPSSDFMHRPEPDFIRVSTPMQRPQELAYIQMKETLLAQIGTEIVTAQNALVQMQKLLQLASGFIHHEDKTIEWVGANKLEAVDDLLDELDEPVIVFAPYIALQDRLMEEMFKRDDRPVFRRTSKGIARLVVWDDVNEIQYLTSDLDEWRKTNGVLLGNQGSGLGIGMNLQHAAATIYVANSFSSEARWQSLARTDRMGQERHCRYWDLVTPGTIDLKVLEALNKKEEVATRNIDGLRELLL